MSEYFPKLKSFGGRVKVELDLSNYATKADLKNATGVDTSKFAKELDLASLKPEVDKLDIDKLEKEPTGSNSLKIKVNKLDIDKLVPVPVDLSKLSDVVKKEVVKKTEYDELVKKVNTIKTTDTRNLVKKTEYNTKTDEIEKKKKKNTDLDHINKYIITQEFNKLTAEDFASKLGQANLPSKNDIATFAKKDRL